MEKVLGSSGRKPAGVRIGINTLTGGSNPQRALERIGDLSFRESNLRGGSRPQLWGRLSGSGPYLEKGDCCHSRNTNFMEVLVRGASANAQRRMTEVYGKGSPGSEYRINLHVSGVFRSVA